MSISKKASHNFKVKLTCYLILQLFFGSFISNLVLPGQAASVNETKKPTSYTDNASLSVNESQAYDSDQATYSETDTSSNQTESVIWHTWQITSRTYTSLSLYVRRSATGHSDDLWWIQYSTNGGSSWSYLENGGSTNPAVGNISVSLSASQNLSLLRVRIGSTKTKGPDGGKVLIYDIWTVGQYEANFQQKQENWRWYDDNVNVPPSDSNALAAENAAPTNVIDSMVLRLRISIKEMNGVNQSAASVRKLQWSTTSDFSSDVHDVNAQGGSGIWRYVNGPATDGASVSSPFKLMGTTKGGLYVESNTSTYQLSASAQAEFEYSIQGNDTVGNQTYYFRLWDVSEGAEISLDTGKSYPRLTTAFQGSLTLSGTNVTWNNVNPDNPPDNTGKGLTCTVTANGSWAVTVTASSGDAEGRMWNAAESAYYDGSFTYTSSGALGPTYQTSATSFTVSPGTNVANWTTAVSNWNITVDYTLGAPTWATLKGNYSATHTYTLSPL